MQHLRCDLRDLLVKSIVWDLDIVNAWPTLMLNLADKHGKPTPTLRKYVSDREDFLKRLCAHYGVSRDDAKVVLHGVSLGGGLQKWKKEHGASTVEDNHADLADFTAECKLLQDLCNKGDAFKSFYNNTVVPYHENKGTTAASHPGSCLARVLGGMETAFMMAFMKELVRRGRTVTSMIYDGCHVLQQSEDTVATINELIKGGVAAATEATGFKGVSIKLKLMMDQDPPRGPINL